MFLELKEVWCMERVPSIQEEERIVHVLPDTSQLLLQPDRGVVVCYIQQSSCRGILHIYSLQGAPINMKSGIQNRLY